MEFGLRTTKANLSDAQRNIIDLSGRVDALEKNHESSSQSRNKYQSQIDLLLERITTLEDKLERIINS